MAPSRIGSTDEILFNLVPVHGLEPGLVQRLSLVQVSVQFLRERFVQDGQLAEVAARQKVSAVVKQVTCSGCHLYFYHNCN